MKKNSAKRTKIGQKRTEKNRARKKRAKALREFNHTTWQVKTMQAYLNGETTAEDVMSELAGRNKE